MSSRPRRARCAATALRIAPSVPGPIVDTCGTGGDGSDSFNISTVAAIVVAACGVTRREARQPRRELARRAAPTCSRRSVSISNLAPERVARCIEEVGIGFMFARVHHPAMKHAGPVRAEIGVRTLFNWLGPLTQPSGRDAIS